MAPPLSSAEPISRPREGWADVDRSGLPRRVRLTRRRDAIFRRLLIAADLVALGTALLVAGVVLGDGLTPVALVTPILLVFAAKAIGLYDRDEHLLHKTTLEEVPTLFALTSFIAIALFLSGELVVKGGLGREGLFAAFTSLFVLGVALRSSGRFVARMVTDPERCLVVGNTSRIGVLIEALKMSPAAHVEIVGVVPIARYYTGEGANPGIPDQMLDELLVDRVIVVPGSHGTDELMFAIRELRDIGVKVSILPDLSRLAGSAFEADSIGGVTIMGMRRFAMSRSSRVIKRGFDLVGSALLLTLLSPVLTAIAIAVRSDSPGPVLFRQERVGRHGGRFSMLKFRSMSVEAESMREHLLHMNQAGAGLFKIPDDPRITLVGRFIRRLSLDELPQLINVLRGDMSLVGPRPLIPEEDERVVGYYRSRLDVRPGITGLWQILGAARVPLDEMVKLDYLYVANWSLWGDLVLLCRTIPVVLRRRGM